MLVISLVLVSAAGGILFAAFAAGGTENRERCLLLSAGAFLLSLLSGAVIFFMKTAFEEIAVKTIEKVRHLSLVMPNWKIPDAIMFHLGTAVCVACLTLFLWSFNCRKNSSRWYYALLWCAGVVFLCGHLLFLPLYSALGAWLNFTGGFSQGDFFQPEMTRLPTFYAMALILLVSGLLWLCHTLKCGRHSWKNILLFAGSFCIFSSLLWLSACCIGKWARQSVDKNAAALGVTHIRTSDAESAESKAVKELNFYEKHAKYNPPLSGRYDWKKDTVPAVERAYTMKFFTSPELETYLEHLKKSAALSGNKDVLYLSSLQHFRSLVRHRMDKASLYHLTGQKEKALSELLTYPETEALIPCNTPYLICELVRAAARMLWVESFIQYAPDEKQHLALYRKIFDWSKSWQIHLPCEAGTYLNIPETGTRGVAGFFYTPYHETLRYRGFFNAIGKRPYLEKLQQQEVFTGDGVFINAARRQRLSIVLGRTALALKLYAAEHGKYPEKLSQLVPAYLPKEYLAPGCGKKLDYAVHERAHCSNQNGVFAMAIEQFFTLSADGALISSNFMP